MGNEFEALCQYPIAAIADAAFRMGAAVRLLPANLFPLKPDSRLAGPVTTVRCNNDLVAVLEGLMRAATGDVLLIDNNGFPGAGCIGDVIVSEAVRKGLAGIVVYGSIRDSRQIAAMGLPVFCTGKCSVGPLKLPGEPPSPGLVGMTLDIAGTPVAQKDILVGDADGVIVLETDRLGELIDMAKEIEQKEGDLMKRIAAGQCLTDIFELEKYLEKRKETPDYPFNRHLAAQDEII